MSQANRKIILNEYLRKGALFCALFLFFSSCQTYSSWSYEQISSCSPCFSSSRLLFNSCDPYVQVEVEMVQGPSGLRMYVNSYSRPFISPNLTVTIDQTKHHFSGTILEGGQRLLLPDALREWIVTALLEGSCVEMAAGPYQTTLFPTNFEKNYFKLSRI